MTGYQILTCKVAGINIPIKSMASRLLNKNFDKITEAIDEQVASNLELKKNVELAWGIARQPVMLAKEFDTWLVIVPTAIVMTPLLAKNNILRSVIGIQRIYANHHLRDQASDTGCIETAGSANR
jgi:hypothetical protein